MEVRPLEEGDRAWAHERMIDRWGDLRVVSRGRLHHLDDLEGRVALDDGTRAGLLTFRVDERGMEVVTLDAFVPHRGVGKGLLESALEIAHALCVERLWLITTNDNVPAQRFYEGFGMTKIAVHEGAIETSRRLKPQIPETGMGGVPITDEVEYEIRLT